MSDDNVIEGYFKPKDKEEGNHNASEMFEALATALHGTESDDVEALAVVYIEGEPLIVAANSKRPDTVNTLLDLAKFSLMTSILEGGEGYDHGPDDGETVH